jgi:radical SAM superfamily enzyme YgiQ (UPF0313 family)
LRIALIAMSGVRASNDELTGFGFTLPGFAERGKVIASLPSLSLLTLAGMTPDRFDVTYHEIADIRHMDALPACDVAAISTYTAQVKDAYELARQYREIGVHTVIGGLHATVLPEEALQHVDTVVVGEGEVSWVELLKDLERRKPKRLYAANGREFDLADAPIPRYDLLDIEYYNRLTVQTQRGCPWKCEFCAASILLTPRYKTKPIEKVLAEIREIKRIWPRPFIEFADDNTFVNKKHSKALMQALAGERVRWFTETDVSVADDDDLLSLMKEAGCAEILIGFETPSTSGLDGLELKRNWKLNRLNGYKAAIERIQSHGIAVNGCFILGLDGDSADVFEAIWTFAREAGLFDVQITVLTPFPGTPLYSRLQAEGRILEEGAWEKCTMFEVNYRPQQMSSSGLQHGLIELGKRIYTDEMKLWRANAFRQHRRKGIQAHRQERRARYGV